MPAKIYPSGGEMPMLTSTHAETFNRFIIRASWNEKSIYPTKRIEVFEKLQNWNNCSNRKCSSWKRELSRCLFVL